MNKFWKVIAILGLILLGKVSGFVKDVLITFYHGVSTLTDAYFLSNSISSVLYMAIYSAIPVLVVPLCSRFTVSESRERINRDLSAAIFFFFFLSLGVSIFVFVAAHQLVEIFSGEVDQRIKDLSACYLSIMALTFSISTLVSLFNSIQTVNKVTIPSYVVPIVNNSVFCVGLYYYNSASDFYKVLLLGVLSWFLLFVVNFFISRKSLSLEVGAAFSLFVNKKFILLFLPAVFSFYVEQINGFVGIYFASELGVGSISVLGYSNKLNMLFLSVFLVFLTASLFPRIATASARDDQTDLVLYLTGCTRLIVICSIPVVIYMTIYSTEIVGLIFQRGKFIVDDVVKVSSVFSIVLLAIPFCLVRDIINRVFFSYNNTLTPVLVSILALAINIFLSFLLYKKFGLIGIAVSAVTATVCNCIIVILLVQRVINFNLIRSCLRDITLCGVGGVIAYITLGLFDTIFSKYWFLLFIPFFIVYFLSLLLFRIKEALLVTGMLRMLFFRESE